MTIGAHAGAAPGDGAHARRRRRGARPRSRLHDLHDERAHARRRPGAVLADARARVPARPRRARAPRHRPHAGDHRQLAVESARRRLRRASARASCSPSRDATTSGSSATRSTSASPTAPTHVSLAAARRADDRVFSVFSLSKTYAMTGVRVGYLVTPPGLAATMRTVQEATISCVADARPVRGARGARRAISSQWPSAREHYRANLAGRDGLLDERGIRYLDPDGRLLPLDRRLATPRGGDVAAWAERLPAARARRVAPGSAFGAPGEGWIRVCLAAPRRGPATRGLAAHRRALHARLVGPAPGHDRADTAPTRRAGETRDRRAVASAAATSDARARCGRSPHLQPRSEQSAVDAPQAVTALEPAVDRPDVHPQLLHHRAHRPRQVDARRPHARHHRRRQRPRHARAVPRPHGHRARARHHHQEPGRAHAVGPRRQADLRAQHDRHPRPRRLHLRGLALARRLRGRDPARRRRAGHRGADAREPLPRARERPRRSSRCSTRSTCRPPTPRSTPASSRSSSAASPKTCCASAARPAWASRSCSTASSSSSRRRRATRTRRPAR